MNIHERLAILSNAIRKAREGVRGARQSLTILLKRRQEQLEERMGVRVNPKWIEAGPEANMELICHPACFVSEVARIGEEAYQLYKKSEKPGTQPNE